MLTQLKGIDPTELKDDSDFFALGLDSVGVGFVSGLLVRAGIDWIDRGIIYKNPTIETLTARLRRGPGDEPLDPDVATSFRLIDKYSCFSQRPPNHTKCLAYLEIVQDGNPEAFPDGHHVVTLHHPCFSFRSLFLDSRSLRPVFRS